MSFNDRLKPVCCKSPRFAMATSAVLAGMDEWPAGFFGNRLVDASARPSGPEAFPDEGEITSVQANTDTVASMRI